MKQAKLKLNIVLCHENYVKGRYDISCKVFVCMFLSVTVFPLGHFDTAHRCVHEQKQNKMPLTILTIYSKILMTERNIVTLNKGYRQTLDGKQSSSSCHQTSLCKTLQRRR